MSRLNPPIHVQQIGLGYCLPACGQMALAQLGFDLNQRELAKVMGTRPGIGTSFSHIKRLTQWSVDVQVTEWHGFAELSKALTSGAVAIAAVTTAPGLPGWGDIRTQHTVLVIQVSDTEVIYHDPAWPHGPVVAPAGEFLLAWSDMAELVAQLRRI